MGKVIIFSAPSGSGKTTLVRHCMEAFPSLAFSVSCTTRPPRGTEQDGVDYHFISPELFRNKIAHHAFVEYEEVYQDKFYGTLKSEVERIWALGKTVIFDVDVKGGVSLKDYFGAEALSIFILPPSVAELERRLVARQTDDAETIKTRVEKALEEMEFQKYFDEIVVNTHLSEAKTEVERLVARFLNSPKGQP